MTCHQIQSSRTNFGSLQTEFKGSLAIKSRNFINFEMTFKRTKSLVTIE